MAAYLYAKQQNIPAAAAWSVLPAFLLELAFYLAPGFAGPLDRLARLGREWCIAGLIVLSAAAPYVWSSLAVGQFRWRSALLVAALAAVPAFWYLAMPRGAAADLAFLCVMAGVFLTRTFSILYVSPIDKLPLDILGRLMWIRAGIAAVLLFRQPENVDFGFLPRREDWSAGARYFFYLLPLLIPAALFSGFVRRAAPVLNSKTALVAIGTFFGMLWVVALAEEFFFRGLLQQWLCKMFQSDAGGLLAASALFGLVHLPFRGFPNWKFALLAMLAGVFYGLAYRRARSIRASMVTHALVNTTWRVLLSG